MMRRATLSDVPAIVELAVEAVSRQPWPVVISRESMTETATNLIKSNAHFAWVAEQDGEVVAAVLAAAQDSFWHERLAASVVMFYTRRPNAGIGLLREFARWVKGRTAIKMAIFSLEPDADPRIGKLLQRLGFGISTPQYVYVRGMK